MNGYWQQGLCGFVTGLLGVMMEGHFHAVWSVPLKLDEPTDFQPPISMSFTEKEFAKERSEKPKENFEEQLTSLQPFAESLDELEREARELAQLPESNEDRFLQPSPDPEDLPAPESSPVFPRPETPREDDPEPIFVRSITITGSTVFVEEDFAEILNEFSALPTTVTRGKLEALADAVTERYLQYNYVSSRAIVNEASLANGEIEIKILEGSVEKIKIEGVQRLDERYISSRVALGLGTPLNAIDLEEQLRLLRADPLFENIEASLTRTDGTAEDTSLLIIRIIEAESLGGEVGADNVSPPSVGSERLKVKLKTLNLTGAGDRAEIEYRRTAQGGFESVEANYAIPLNPRNGTLQVRTTLQNNTVVQEPFDVLDILGDSRVHEISFRQPLTRNTREEFALSLGFTYQTGQTESLFGPVGFGTGPDSEGRTTTSVLKFGQDYLRRDRTGAWGARSQFSLGVGIFNATINADPIPDGCFLSWLGQLQRVQVLDADRILVMSADVQFSTTALLSSQQFVIGGGQSVRGYRQNVRNGDNGVRVSVEDRITLERDNSGQAVFQLLPFFDAGWVWNDSSNPNSIPDQNFIASFGFGAIWKPHPDLEFRFDYGIPLINLSDRGTNAQDDGVHFNIRHRF
ncbi:MAG: ShlB/FhaC/HecB family hemolysin secretion/activation protein [Cyanobacteria bacterium SBLK]|nr:ShlB/FhaC/HecB family hemolysin secretion/activation protein [Cyanobacteria bacterium SBLK]